MVQFFVVDKEGQRRTVRGLEGTKLSVALQEYGQIDDAFFMPHPYDTSYPDCHVYVGYDYLDKLPPLAEEDQTTQQRLIEDFARLRARENSRMGYFVELTPQLSGMTVAVGEIEPWETC